MQRIKKLIVSTVAGLSSVVLMASPAAAAAGYSLFGNASEVSPGNASDTAIQLTSNMAEPEPYAGIDFDIDADTSWAELTTLSTDYNVTDDDCGAGSPRFQLNIDTDGDGNSDGNVHVAIGPSPNFTDCALGWQSTGNLIGNEDAGRYDYSQFGGSTFTTYSDVPASVLAGDVVGIQLVVDSGWNANAANGEDQEQTVLADNTTINTTVNDYEPEVEEPEMPVTKDECKKGGWEGFGVFKNQGDCVSWVATNGRNPATGLVNF